MPFPVYRPRTVLATTVSIGLAFAASACEAPRHHASTANVIVVPDAQQATSTIDTSHLDWLSRFTGAGSGTSGR